MFQDFQDFISDLLLIKTDEEVYGVLLVGRLRECHQWHFWVVCGLESLGLGDYN